MKTRWMEWARSAARDPRWWVVAGVGVIATVAVVLTYQGTSRPEPTEPSEPAGFTVFPQGEDVPRLTPIKVTFKDAPSEREGEKLLQVQPAVPGKYEWLSDRTLLFQPDYPGLLRGKEYAVAVAARPEAGLDQPFNGAFTTEGVLTVESVIPAPNDTEVPKNAQVFVQFSRSVAPLTLLSEQSSEPVVTFDPPLPGKGEWLNTSLYRYIPDAVAPNTTYRLKVPAGLSSAADGVLKEDYTWSFSSYGPALDTVTPDNNTQFGSPTQSVTLAFNQPMDQASVATGFKMTSASGAAVAGAFGWLADGTTATFTPNGKLALSTRYDLLVPKGLKGASGGETQAEWKSSFTTVGVPAVVSTQPPAGQSDAQRYGVSFRFNNPMDMDSLDGLVTISGIEKDKIVQQSYGDELNLYLSVALKPSTNYTVSLAAGGKDRYGQALAPFSFSFRTGALPSSVSFAIPNFVGTYSASAEPLLFYHATNVSQASFRLYPLTADEMATIRSNNGPPAPPRPNEVWVPSSPPLRQWTEPVDGPKDEVLIDSTSLSGGGQLTKGDYYVMGGSVFAFSVVDTAIVTKIAQDELLAWTLDLDSGKPVAGVTLAASGPSLANNSATTDASGLASFTLTAAAPDDRFYAPRSAYQVLLNDAGRRGVASTLWNQGTQPWQLNIPVEYQQRVYVGYAYTDRPIYRPGEEVFVKGVIRADDDAAYSIPGQIPDLAIVVHEAQGKQLTRQNVALNEFGTFGFSFTLPADASIGEFNVQVTWTASSSSPGDPTRYITGAGFTVAEFRKPEFQVTVTTDKPFYANGDTIAGSADAQFYFGGQLAGAQTEWAVLASPFVLRVKGFERYSFADFDYFKQSVVRDAVRAQGKTVTGADGVASFSAPAVLKGDEGAQDFTVAATVTDQSAQAVANSTHVTVHPASLYAGIKPAEYVAVSGKETAIDLVTVDTQGNLLPNRPVTVKVYERTWVTTKEQTPEGARRYRSEPVDKLVATLQATTDGKSETQAAYTPTNAGTLRLVAEVTDEKGRTARSAAYLWVSGQSFASWQVTNDDTIALVADKDSYEVGDTAEILVPAPFAGATGLVTVERGKIITRAVQQFPTNSETIRIPITDRSVPDVFVTVALYRPPTAEDPVPRYKVGYVKLTVSTVTRQLTVSIQPDRPQAKPGDKVTYKIKVTDAQGRGVKSELSVAVVDKAVLALADERGPDGLHAFWFERGLGVSTGSSLSVSVNRSNDVISEPQTGGKGGSGDEGDRLRQDFRNTAYWSAQIKTGDDGTASVEVTMPDNLTTWRMLARAVSGDTMVGEGTNELVSTQPLLLRPALPRFLRVGDKTTLRLLVRNATDAATDVTVALQAEGVELTGKSTQKVTIKPGTSETLEWPATVSKEGTAKLKFSATGSNGLSDSVLQQLPVALDVTPETMSTGGVVKDQPLYEALYLPVYAILKNGFLSVSVQSSLTGSMASELKWFEKQSYEIYEGTDKVAGRVIATIGVRRADKSAGLNTSTLDSQTQTDLATLIGRQRADGGFAWCPVYCDSDPQVTGWALMALGEANKEGANVDGGAVALANRYVSTYINRLTDLESPADANEKAFLLYALARAGQAEQQLSTMRALQQQYRAKLTNWGRAYLVLGMAEAGVKKDDPQVGQLLNDLATAVTPSANGNHWEDERVDRSTHTSTRTTALVLDALVREDPSHPLIEETVRWLMVARSAQGWSTMVERAQAILSLSEYAVQTGELAGNFGYQVKLGEKEILNGRYKPGDGAKTDVAKVPLTTVPTGKVTLLGLLREAATPGRLYYTMNLKYVTPAKDVEAVSRGVSISHQYTLLEDPKTPVDHAKLGDTVRVTVTVVAPADRNYVVAEDLLPAGLEPVDPKLKTTDPKLKAQLDAERSKLNKPAVVLYYAPWFRWYYSPWQQVDTRDDRVTLRAQNLPKGVHEYVYYARATSPGDYFVAPAHIEETYFPEVWGRSDSGRLVIGE